MNCRSFVKIFIIKFHVHMNILTNMKSVMWKVIMEINQNTVVAGKLSVFSWSIFENLSKFSPVRILCCMVCFVGLFLILQSSHLFIISTQLLRDWIWGTDHFYTHSKEKFEIFLLQLSHVKKITWPSLGILSLHLDSV